jgi:hypothetical protein
MSGHGSAGRPPATTDRPMAQATRPVPRRRRLRVTPTRVTLLVAFVGSVLFILYALTVRDASQIPLLVAGAVVLGIVFTALAIAGLAGTYTSARDARTGTALLQAIGGGIAVLIAFGCFTLAAVLVLLLRAPATGS